MGVVYRARDPRLERDVALKVLPPEAATDEEARTRLVREARLAAKLNHPHICTIHEVGEAEGQVYIAMELVEGQSLSTILAGGALPAEQALRYGIQVADALDHAHGRGVVHRDLKSANVVITPEGRAKVLDFGLAKRLADDEMSQITTQLGASLTAPGSMVGTLAYMAPEQLRGHPADARSDIWALGMVLYEMAAGCRPFKGKTAPALSAAILNDTPPPLPASVPDPLRAVIERCLAKDPSQRLQTAEETRTSLEIAKPGGVIAAPRSGPSALRRRRWALIASALAAIAVLLVVVDAGGIRRLLPGRGDVRTQVVRMAILPFANLSGDPEQEYLSDGLTQEMISQLGRLHPEGLSVIARTSVMRYKNGDTPIDQIGRELGVTYVLEGSARREANRVRISAELVNVQDQTQLWADTYERELSDILSLQSEVAQRVARALALELLPAVKARLADARSVNPEAYEAYLKGSHHWKKLTPEGCDTAQRYFELALEKDPSYAPAYEGLANVWGVRNQMGIAPHDEAAPRARAAAMKAVELDETSSGAHFALAGFKTWGDWDWAGAEPEWQRALELNPNRADAHAYYAHFLAIMGRTGQAVTHSERAIELDPFNALFHALHGVTLRFDRRYDAAMTAARRALEMQPDMVIASNTIHHVRMVKGMRDEILADARQRIAHEPEFVAAFEQGLAEGGYEGAQRRIADLLAALYEESGGSVRSIWTLHIAGGYLEAGDHDRAIDWLEKAFEAHESNLPYIRDPLWWDALSSNPRFQDLLRRMNLPLD
jgi:serine/threonine-protein kinase